MKVALVGSTGFVGQAILKELTDRNHEVTAIARDVTKLKDLPNVIAIQADVNDVNALSSALKGSDAVVNAFNPGWTNPNLYEDFTKGSRSILEAVKESGVKRYVVIGGAGSLYIGDKQLIEDENFPKAIKPGALAATEYLEVIKREDELDWTFFSPSIEMSPETSGKRTGKYRTGLENPVFNDEGRSVISVEDLAVAIVDELENNKFVQKRFTAGY
ncbi:NAD(P)-dependent oxidoreductase [Sphingobacterium hungaricum]|uniref:Histidine kinase n=1 Tax=Sphingobacterium hungaricum TaxID=2082723 RepID=A0A928UYU0_9SPHI|nr:NAD(P)H-binding protein [Sphingobacterium hungaricum]MBE8715192.1 histidine kinase [Sphingobacterium hungaricum]